MRESLNICFYMHHPHQEIAPSLARALEIYLRAIGHRAPAWYPDDNGDWWELDASAWEDIWRKLRAGHWPGNLRLHWCDSPSSARDYEVEYCGKNQSHLSQDAVCALSFWLPSEYLEEQGPDRVRDLVLELAQSLPFCSGHAGLAFNHVGAQPEIHRLRFRHPGMDDVNLGWVSCTIGARVRGPAWMNFLGKPVLGELGGPAGLRSRLSFPGISVRELPNERAVITLGSWPEAGDLERGLTLPHYRELARVLSPWLYQERPSQDAVAAEETHRWERRFLE